MDFEKIFKPFSSWKVVLLSFLGATTFWFFSALGKQYNTRIKAPLQLGYDADSLILMRPIQEYVEVDVTGGGWDLFRQRLWFGNDPILIEPDNPASIKFLTRPTILPMVSDHLKQFQINFLYTDTLHIDIDRKVSRQVELAVDSLAISLESNYRIVSPIEVSPDSAVIFGPSRFIDTLSSTYTIPVEAQEIDRGFDRFVSLGLPDGFSISSQPSTSKVTFEVERFETLRIPVALELINFPEDSSVLPSKLDVAVKFVMQRSLQKDLYADDFKIILDRDMIDLSDSTAPVIIMISPENVLEVEVEPDTVKIDFRE